MTDYAPETAFEPHLVEQLASLMWRQRRIADVEAWEARRKMGKAGERGYGYEPDSVLKFRGIESSQEPDVGETLFAPAGHAEQQIVEVKEVLKAFEAAINLLNDAKPDAYERALAALPTGTREWWGELRKDKPVLTATTPSLLAWLSDEPTNYFTRRLNDLSMRDEHKDDLCGFATKAIVSTDTVMRYEAHISRQIERTVTLLDRTRLMRPSTGEKASFGELGNSPERTPDV